MTAEEINKQFGGTYDLNGDRISNVEEWILNRVDEMKRSWEESEADKQ